MLILLVLVLTVSTVFTNDDMQIYIFDGHDASIEDYPYQVGLSLAGAWCSGSLISQTWIVTAAHCIGEASPEDIKAYLGSAQIAQGTEMIGRNVITHPDYNPPSLANDIALIEIDSINYSETIRQVLMAEGDDTFVGREVIATGWGGTYIGSPLPETLQQGELIVQSNSDCEPLDGKQMCASANVGEASICPGDSGGPLVLKENKVLVGISSFIVGDCEAGNPNGFTRITSYRQWIRDNSGV